MLLIFSHDCNWFQLLWCCRTYKYLCINNDLWISNFMNNTFVVFHQAFDIFFCFYILGVGVVLGVFFFVNSLCCYGQSSCFKNWGSIPPQATWIYEVFMFLNYIYGLLCNYKYIYTTQIWNLAMHMFYTYPKFFNNNWQREKKRLNI